MYGYDVVPSMVFVGAASDQGMNVVNAFGNCGVEVVLCNAHRLNTAVHWALGIAGSDATNMNPALVGKIAALVGHFSHSSANNDAFRAVQEAKQHAHPPLQVARRPLDNANYAFQKRRCACVQGFCAYIVLGVAGPRGDSSRRLGK